MQPFEFYKLAKDDLLDARLQQVANFLAEQNDTTSIVTQKYDMIKVNYENSPYFKLNKEFWRDIETPLERITPKEFTLNPLQDDDAFMQELMFQYNNRFSNESPISKKWSDAAKRVNRPQAISGKSKSIATFDDCKTLGDYQKKAEALGILKPEYSLNDIDCGKYSIDDFKEIIEYYLTDMNEILKTKEMIEEELRGNKND